MSYYYNYEFTSPKPIFSIVKEELKSYFTTGVVDDILFPTYVDKCLQSLRRGVYKIEELIVHIDDFQAQLPGDFEAVREAWLCEAVYDSHTIKDPSSIYTQETVLVDQYPPYDICTDKCSGLPDRITVTYKTNDALTYTYTKSCLLKPGRISRNPDCDLPCRNYGSSSWDSFDVRGGKFWTNFRTGDVYLLYYKEEVDECDNQMIPDTFQVKEYIEAFLKYKVFEMLSNTVVDETAAQIERKKQEYEIRAGNAFVIADNEMKKEDVYDKQRAHIRALNRNNRYKISNGSRRRYHYR